MRILVRPHLGTPLTHGRFNEVGCYAQQVIGPDAGPIPDRPWAVEMSAVTEHQDSVDDPERYAREVTQIKKALGHRFRAIDLDEPLTKVRLRAGLGMAPEDIVTRYVAPVVRSAAQRGIAARWIEAWPALSWSVIRAGLQQARVLDLPITRLVIDLDWNRVDDEAPTYAWWQRLLRRPDPRFAYRARLTADLDAMRQWCTTHGVELGLIVGSPMVRSDPRTDSGFLESAATQLDWIGDWVGWPWADVVYVQSWEDFGPSLDTLERAVEMVERRGHHPRTRQALGL